jgi:hypothetical protein
MYSSNDLPLSNFNSCNIQRNIIMSDNFTKHVDKRIKELHERMIKLKLDRKRKT